MGKGRAPCCDKSQVKRGPWSSNEDLRLITFIQKYGHDNWRALPKQAGLQRCGKSCRLRWINYLRPDVKRGHFTLEEEEAIIKLHQSLGNKWSKIAAQFPGRTDNEIKNVWNTHLKKRLSPKTTKKCSTTMSSSCSSNSIKSNDDQNIVMTQTSEAKEPTVSSSPSYNSNATKSNQVEVPKYDQEHDNGPFELPSMEFDFDFWNILDTLGCNDEIQDPHELLNIDNQSLKWLQDFENELQLEATMACGTNEFSRNDSTNFPPIVGGALTDEALIKQGLDYAAKGAYH